MLYTIVDAALQAHAVVSVGCFFTLCFFNIREITNELAADALSMGRGYLPKFLLTPLSFIIAIIIAFLPVFNLIIAVERIAVDAVDK